EQSRRHRRRQHKERRAQRRGKVSASSRTYHGLWGLQSDGRAAKRNAARAAQRYGLIAFLQDASGEDSAAIERNIRAGDTDGVASRERNVGLLEQPGISKMNVDVAGSSLHDNMRTDGRCS